MHPNSRYQCILTTINTKQKILGFLKTKFKPEIQYITYSMLL